MLYLKTIVVLGALLWSAGFVQAAPQLLLELPLESPGEDYSANVEWDEAGFIGRIRMHIYTRGEKPTKTVELPQIKPLPANLIWITNEWVACESFVAERGAAFFYMHVPRGKGYMIEIFAPEADGDWLISYTTNDSVSSGTIDTISRSHSSLFPILLRDLPQDGLSYLSADFPYLLADAVDSFAEWRKRERFTEMKFLTPIAEKSDLGRLVVASTDGTAEIIYFPQGTTTTREMLALTQRQPLPESVQRIINGIDPPAINIEWTSDTGDFHVTGKWEDGITTETELITGRFEGVSDSVYSGPGIKDLLRESESSNGGDNTKDSKTKSTSSEAKKPTSSSAKSSSSGSGKSSSTTKSSSKSSAKSKSPSRSK